MRSALFVSAMLLALIPLAFVPLSAADGCTERVVCSDANLPGAGCQSTWVQDPNSSIWIGEASCPARPAGGGTFTCWYLDTIQGWVPLFCTP
jgi:hypothetical protein